MPASRYDLEWDRGGDWEIIVGRATRAGVVLPASAGSLEVREIDAPSTTPALHTVTGSLTDQKRVRLRVPYDAHDELPAERYEHRMILVDETSGRRIVLLRGYVTLLDSVGDG